jgi:REP element-mobilizing transposase RayT
VLLPPVTGLQRRERNLPHLEAPGETYFLTLVLRRPASVDLTEQAVGVLVVDSLRFFDGSRYLLFDFTVIPDHVHAIIKPLVRDGVAESLSRITHSLKSWLAQEINRVCGRSGRLWERETYDHILRNEVDYLEKAAYILDNPRRRDLITNSTEWPWWGKGSGCSGQG